jgi:predicted nucleotidyltransferase
MSEVDELVNKGAALLRLSGAREVYVFGSVASDKLREGSDIDLAVSGLPPATFFDTLARLTDLLDRPVDLVDLDDVSPFTAYLRDKGLLRRVA